jgi:hypothetical protein
VNDEQRVKEKTFDREARRLERLRTLRLVEQPPAEKVELRPEVEYEPKDAA